MRGGSDAVARVGPAAGVDAVTTAEAARGFQRRNVVQHNSEQSLQTRLAPGVRVGSGCSGDGVVRVRKRYRLLLLLLLEPVLERGEARGVVVVRRTVAVNTAAVDSVWRCRRQVLFQWFYLARKRGREPRWEALW